MEDSVSAYIYGVMLIDLKGQANRTLIETNDLQAALETVPFSYDPALYQPVIRRWSDDRRDLAENLFTWRGDKWMPCTIVAKDILRGTYNPPDILWTCHDWASGEPTFDAEDDVKVEECSGCPDVDDCDGPIPYGHLVTHKARELAQNGPMPLKDTVDPLAQLGHPVRNPVPLGPAKTRIKPEIPSGHKYCPQCNGTYHKAKTHHCPAVSTSAWNDRKKEIAQRVNDAQVKNKKMGEQVNEVLIPKTLEEAVQFLVKELCDKDAANATKWMEMDEKEATCKVHHMLGRNLRNEWKLWEDSLIVRHMYDVYGISHGDDISSMFVTCLHREMNSLPWDAEGQAVYYRKYWKKKGGQPKPPWEFKPPCQR